MKEDLKMQARIKICDHSQKKIKPSYNYTKYISTYFITQKCYCIFKAFNTPDCLHCEYAESQPPSPL